MIALITTLVLVGGVRVTLPMTATVKGSEIRLGEIAVVEAVGPVGADELLRVSSLELGYAPAPGYSRLIQAHKIEELLSVRFAGIEVQVTGQRACRVRPETTTVSSDDIVAEAKRELQRRIGAKDASYELAAALPKVVVPAGAGSLKVKARRRDDNMSGGLVNVPVEIHVDGMPYRTIWTSWRVDVWQVRPVLTRNVRAGESLTENMFQRARVRADLLGPVKPLGTEAMAGSIAARDMTAGEVLTHLDVNRPTVVRLGDGLLLSVKKGAIEARVSAVAMESGAIGDNIRVRAQESGKELTGRIESRGLVRVDLGK